MNVTYIFSKQGTPKAVTLILGLVSVSMIGHAYDRSYYNNVYKGWLETRGDNMPLSASGLQKEVYFLSVAVICLLISFTLLLCHLLTEEVETSPEIKLLDGGFHAVGAVLLIIGGILAIMSANDLHKLEEHGIISNLKDTKFQYKSEKIAAGVFGVINGIVYAVVAVFVFIYRNKS